MTTTNYYATGKRKSAVARVWILPGQGSVSVNRCSVEEYFGRETSRMEIQQPFEVTNTSGQFDVRATVEGGGLSGQAGAIKHGIAKALLVVNPGLRQLLKRAGFLTRDSRVKERKKYGQKGAGKRFQFSKR